MKKPKQIVLDDSADDAQLENEYWTDLWRLVGDDPDATAAERFKRLVTHLLTEQDAMGREIDKLKAAVRELRNRK